MCIIAYIVKQVNSLRNSNLLRLQWIHMQKFELLVKSKMETMLKKKKKGKLKQ